MPAHVHLIEPIYCPLKMHPSLSEPITHASVKAPQYASLVKKGRWGTIRIFRENAMASLDAVAQITTIRNGSKRMGGKCH